LSEPLEGTGQKQADWRTDPARSGAGGCVGDIGTHAYQLAGYVAGVAATELCAELSTFVEGRRLDDNVQVMLRFANGARGALWASQVAPGNENNLRLRVYGSRGGIEWHQEQPNQLVFSPFGQPTQTIARSGSGAGAAAARVTRPPAGHPRAISKRSRRSTARSPRRSAPGVAAHESRPRGPVPGPRRRRRRGRVHRRRGRLGRARRALGSPAGASIETLIDLFSDAIRLPASTQMPNVDVNGHHR
jgi:predicted dehydrogenase